MWIRCYRLQFKWKFYAIRWLLHIDFGTPFVFEHKKLWLPEIDSVIIDKIRAISNVRPILTHCPYFAERKREGKSAHLNDVCVQWINLRVKCDCHKIPSDRIVINFAIHRRTIPLEWCEWRTPCIDDGVFFCAFVLSIDSQLETHKLYITNNIGNVSWFKHCKLNAWIIYH